VWKRSGLRAAGLGVTAGKGQAAGAVGRCRKLKRRELIPVSSAVNPAESECEEDGKYKPVKILIHVPVK